MKEGYTHITVVLDKSGSMAAIKSDTIGGFNTFLKGQQETAKDFDTFTFVQFSGDSGFNRVTAAPFYSHVGVAEPTSQIYNFVYKNARIKDAKELTDKTFVPSGGTPLLDTLGDTIMDLGKHLDNLPEEEKPSRVVFVIITDGEENTSKRYSKTAIKNLISEQSKTWKWEFVFLGANQDAIVEARNYGIDAFHAMSYGTSSAAVEKTYSSLTRSINTLKVAPVSMNFVDSGATFTVAERAASMTGDANTDVTTAEASKTGTNP